jgi:NADH-quinone oxidoreductase subunit J
MTNYEMFFFFFFSSIVLASYIFVIYSKNTVFSLFFLFLVFVNSSGLLLLSEIEFLAFMLIIIYVGAITILFLFVIMMLDIPVQKKKEFSNFGYIPILSLITFIFFVETILMFSKNFTLYYHMIVSSPLHSYFFFKIDLINKLDFITNIETLGQILYTYYSIFFLMAGIILLIALIGAVALTKKEIRKKKLLQNNLFKQVSRNSFIAIFNTN